MVAIPMIVHDRSKKEYHLVMTFTVRHGKIHHAINRYKPFISMGHFP